MTEFLVYIAASVDGFIARAGGELDWLPGATPQSPPGPVGEDHGYDAFMARVDALVMGRGTYEVVRAFPEWPYAGRRVVVLSRTLGAADLPDGTEVHPGPVDALAAQLRAQGVRGVYVDGGQTIQAFLRVGLVTELTVTRTPVLLGGGIPLFGSLAADLPLEHVRTQAYPSGFVQSVYRPVLSGETVGPPDR